MKNAVSRLHHRVTTAVQTLRRQAQRTEVFRVLQTRTLHLSGPDPRALAQSDAEGPLVLCLVRNGLPHIDLFLSHHRAMGAERFLFLDNGSEDGTVKRLGQEPDICVMQTNIRFAGNDADIRAWMVSAWAEENWTLMLDIDELFDAPYLDQIDLAGLTEYCDQTGADAVLCHMLDMYPAKLTPSPARTIRQADYPFFETATLETVPYPEDQGCHVPEGLNAYQGGVHARLFGIADMPLSKACLFRPGSARRAYDNYSLVGAHFADISGVLLHYKFTPTFHDRVSDALEREHHWNASAHYKSYAQLTAGMAPINMLSQDAEAYQSAEDLVEQGLLTAGSGYIDFLDSRAIDHPTKTSLVASQMEAAAG